MALDAVGQPPSPVPEPASWALLALGMAVVCAAPFTRAAKGYVATL